ncbi:MAG TPA: hypothetical protein VF605_00995 [Allosphingosinicella sp.]|jgi:hypothetical protein
MMARGFKPVGWVAAVAGAALGCYMLSLNVAAERAELAGIERRIIGAKQDIRSLQTELGTRGRLAQLDHWNAEVLALAAPTSAQFLRDEFTLARFDQREKTVEERAKVQLASAPAKPAKPDLKPAKIIRAAAPAPAAPAVGAQPATPMVRRAALVIGADKPLATVRKAGLIDDRLVAAIGAAAKAEKRAGGQ